MLAVDNYVPKILEIATNFNILLIILIVAFIFKIGILIKLLLYKRSSKASGNQLLLLLSAIGTAILINGTWILKTANYVFIDCINPGLLLFCVRITWAILTLHYHCLALFIESLVKKKDLFTNKRQKLSMLISSLLVIFFIVLSIGYYNTALQTPFEMLLIKIVPYYYLFGILLISLLACFFALRSHTVPRLLKRQFYIFIRVLFLPIAISEFIHFYPIKSLYIGKKYTITAFSISLLTYALYVCLKKIISLRFLNLNEQVQSKKMPNKELSFIHDMKHILEKLHDVTNIRELIHITKSFFKDTFAIPMQKTNLYIRNLQDNEQADQPDYNNLEIKNITQDESTIEAFFSTIQDSEKIKLFLKKEKIIVYDELAFSNFYKEEKTHKKLLSFLNHLNADIFIPLYEHNKKIAYIIIERFAREHSNNKNHDFYSNLECDQMLIFASYLGKCIDAIHKKNVNKSMQTEKELLDTLYTKELEIQHYKQSIRSFLRHTKEKKIGILVYKNRIFTPINQIAQIMVPININTHSGHPISKSIRNLVNQVIEYKQPQTCSVKNLHGEKLIIAGIPYIEKNNVIITLRYPELSDMLGNNISKLKNPTLWEYALYLETTELGKRINTFIPSNCEPLLNFKVSLLRAAFCKYTLLLKTPEKDCLDIIELLRIIMKKETVTILDIKKANTLSDVPIQLFGGNTTKETKNTKETIGLLQKLDKTGILIIQNGNLATRDIQNRLIEYIKYGIYTSYGGHIKKKSDVRILFLYNEHFAPLAEKKLFSQELFTQLNKNIITMPEISSLCDEDISELTQNITKQIIATDEFHHILELTSYEKKRIITSSCTSLTELKALIEQIIIKKSQRQSIYDETKFDPAYSISDPEIIEAARLGKHALRDPKIMSILWNKCKNQNKIANLLGVNRSSVNRRLKDYGLL